MNLSDGEKLALAQGWPALQKLLEASVLKFREKLHLTDPAATKEVLVNHQCYVAAAAFYEDIVKQVTQETQGYAPTPRILPDTTEEILQ